MARRTALIALALAAAIALAAGALWASRPARDAASDRATAALFALTLPDADGAQRSLQSWRGKLLVVNFWATWCGPCVEEMPELQRFADEFAQRNVAVIGIGVDDADKIRDFRRQHQLRIPLLAAGFDGMQLAQQLGNPEPVLPYTALISPDGRLVEEHSGRVQAPELRRWVAEYGSH
ncbi:MAG TPA: TlpA disulfide reductase family protein [Burkholderiaceae bacterium]|jgi:peroxiredoxin|nr:TlpA disulfide reductase family protein [Burkholderiaceae bacterium]